MTRILVVEDDASIRLGLEDTLRANGYEVEAVSRGDVALQRARDHVPDLIILDIMLPDMDGFEVCKHLKNERPPLSEVPVIVLSARGAELDRVRGFDLGADDYVTKPFSLMELLARVRAVLRRAEGGQRREIELMSFGDVRIDFRRQQATKGGADVSLSARSYAILRVLAARPGEVISREELMDSAWGREQYPNTRTVDNHLVKLRKALENRPEAPVYLQTVHGAGYRFVPEDDSDSS